MAGFFVGNNAGALGELQHNHQDSAARSPRKSREEAPHNAEYKARSPTKSTLGRLGFRHNAEKERSVKTGDIFPQKPKKAKSSTNLAGLLSRPKSLKNLYRMAMEDESRSKDKENESPDVATRYEPPPPIFAQFTSDKSVMHQTSGLESSVLKTPKERPLSVQIPRPNDDATQPPFSSKTQGHAARPKSMHPGPTARSKFPSGFGHNQYASASRTCSRTDAVEPARIDPKEIDRQLEALLDRRNIPENQRYKMRNLTDTIKLEFIRQDHAEMQAAKADCQDTRSSVASDELAVSSNATSPTVDESQEKRSRGRSFTFSRGKKDSSSPNKKTKGEGTLGRHFRSRSTDSVASETRLHSNGHSVGASILSKIKAQQGPSDYVAYLRKVQQPKIVEVGKLHKLRLLLRNETVAWIEEFMNQGGMQEIVGLLNRIMEVEWRYVYQRQFTLMFVLTVHAGRSTRTRCCTKTCCASRACPLLQGPWNISTRSRLS